MKIGGLSLDHFLPISTLRRSRQNTPSPRDATLESTPPTSKVNILPPEVWLQVAQWLDDNTLKRLLSLNTTFYGLALAARYRDIAVDATGDRFKALGHLHGLFKRLR